MITSVVPNVPVTNVEIVCTIVNQDIRLLPFGYDHEIPRGPRWLGEWVGCRAWSLGHAEHCRSDGLHRVDGGDNCGRVAVRDTQRWTARVVPTEQFDQTGRRCRRFTRLECIGDAQSQQR